MPLCFPRRFDRLALAAVVLTLGALSATAQDWVATVSDDGNGADGVITIGPTTLTVGCTREGRTALTVLLSGLPEGSLEDSEDVPEALTLRIRRSGGAPADYAINGFYLEADAAFVGQLDASGAALRDFAQGSELQLLTEAGATVFGAPMRGTGAFRVNMRRACGI